MKYSKLIIVIASAFLFVSCGKEEAIEQKKKASKDAIDSQKEAVDVAAKEAVDVAAKEAKKSADLDAVVEKADIEAKKKAAQAQLDADKKKLEAAAEAAETNLDAENK